MLVCMGDRVTSLNFDTTILERIEKREREIKEMPFAVIKKSALPILGRGKEGKPSITISNKGQISFSPMACKVFGDLRKLAVGWDSKNRQLQFQAVSKVPKGYTDEDLFVLGTQKKSRVCYFAASNLLQDENVNLGYDYKHSGNQTFSGDAISMDEDTHIITVTLPKGALTPKEVKPRNKKANSSTAAPSAPPKVAAAGANGSVVPVAEE